MESAETSDGELLGRYVRNQSDDAFAELARRHLNLVYSAALRQVDGDVHAAEDIAQRVFMELARQARRLRAHPTLVGWLHTTTRQIAGHDRRSGQRRARREQEAYAMQEQNHTMTDEWHRLRPVLDEAMGELPESDRLALLLRFFEGQDLRKVGEVLGLNENAARMRVQRALEKLEQILTRRRIKITAAGLAMVLTAKTITAAPAALFASLAVGSAVGIGAVGSGFGGFTATKSTIIAMKIPLSYASILLLASAPLVIQQIQLQKTRAELGGLQREAAPLEPGGSGNSGGSGGLITVDEWARLRRGEAELASLREEAGRIEASLAGPRGPEWANAEAELKRAEAARHEAVAETEAVVLRAKTVNAMKQIGLAARIFSSSNGEHPPKTFEEMKEILGPTFAEAEALERYEFYPQPRAISEAEPQLFMFREKEPRQLPNGKWERSYTLADGSVQNAVSDGVDFSAWEEQAHGVASPEIPEALRGDPVYAPKPE